MSGSIRPERRSLRALRWRARLPKLAAAACVAMLALAGLRAGLTAPPGSPATRGAAAGPSPALDALAEAFARAYLTPAPDRQVRLRAFLSASLDPEGGYSPSAGRSPGVGWTAVAGRRQEARRTVVTVAVELGADVVYLAVPVQRDERGFLSVSAYPALVGAPATDPSIDAPAEDEVADGELRAVAERAVRNYLAGERRDLAADLVAGAVVSLPARTLTVASVESITWARTGRVVAVQVLARDADGGAWTLRYELAVVRRERWYVRALHVNPRSKGVS